MPITALEKAEGPQENSSELTGAIEGTRTPTPLPVHGPEPCASANSATMAMDFTAAARTLRHQEDLPLYSTDSTRCVKRRTRRALLRSGTGFPHRSKP